MRLTEDLKGTITWRKKYLRRLLCKHEFKWYTLYGQNAPLRLRGERRYSICCKCGEFNGSIFCEYEGNGFK